MTIVELSATLKRLQLSATLNRAPNLMGAPSATYFGFCLGWSVFGGVLQGIAVSLDYVVFPRVLEVLWGIEVSTFPWSIGFLLFPGVSGFLRRICFLQDIVASRGVEASLGMGVSMVHLAFFFCEGCLRTTPTVFPLSLIHI